MYIKISWNPWKCEEINREIKSHSLSYYLCNQIDKLQLI